MKVNELILRLQLLPQNYDVMFEVESLETVKQNVVKKAVILS